MSTDSAISVKGLSKRYRIGAREQASGSLIESVVQVLKSPYENYRRLKKLTKFDEEDESVFWALQDISFEVKRGDVLGIIGHNGSGKSTLLKILSRISEPTKGEATLHGRVSSLLEVGTGFHPDLTGRENVFMNGTILGMTRREITSKFDEIVEFSGVTSHIDTAVKYYSSGMKVRLGFAVAAHLEPEILIVDEVLSVGDIGFQRKCIGKMNEVAGNGRTVLFVSHNMAAIENICTSAMLLDHGKNIFAGSVRETVSKYISIFRPQNGADFFTPGIKRTGTGIAKITGFEIRNSEHQVVDMVKSGEHLVLNFQVHADQAIDEADIGFSIHREEDDQLLFILYSSYTGQLVKIKAGESSVSCRLESLPLPEGRYLVHAAMMKDGETVDWPTAGVGYVDVLEGDFYGTGQKSGKLTRSQPLFLVNGKWN